MYRILCITGGDYIKMNRFIAISELHLPGIPGEIRGQMYPLSIISTWDYAEFETYEAASWFISHRLVYNPRRKNSRKLNIMKQLFDFNSIPGWQTSKLEFEIQKA